jgi:hypothetical protein
LFFLFRASIFRGEQGAPALFSAASPREPGRWQLRFAARSFLFSFDFATAVQPAAGPSLSDPFFGLHWSGAALAFAVFSPALRLPLKSAVGPATSWPPAPIRSSLGFVLPAPAHRQDSIPTLDRFRCQPFSFSFTFLLRSDKTSPKSLHGQQHFFVPVSLPPVRSGSPLSFSRRRLDLAICRSDSSPGRDGCRLTKLRRVVLLIFCRRQSLVLFSSVRARVFLCRALSICLVRNLLGGADLYCAGFFLCMGSDG